MKLSPYKENNNLSYISNNLIISIKVLHNFIFYLFNFRKGGENYE